ncbi:MAG: SusC/RagA family TonB-linked outer membrane protein [Chitinophagaceae bacterium]|nr:SusC/RagA family TonB-linked outer membrane protein [Chitinophagaceae bacterium]
MGSSIKLLLLPFFMGLFIQSVVSQTTLRGRVLSSDNGQPVSGISVVLKGSTAGTSTTPDGSFALKAKKGDVIVLSGVGIKGLEYTISNEGLQTIRVETQEGRLEEVVVTALGIRKDRKKLGYAIQDIKGDALTSARETNVVNQLAGKVAGVTVVGSNSGIGGSARVTIRGERSVDMNKNQPLYVVDGVPISNSVTGSNGRNNLEVDYGNGAGFVNPDDIESISVLKGPAASALYGSRAANGVIMIKTKSGARSKGMGVEINSNYTLQSALKLPEYQTVYGQGNGNGGAFAFVNGAGAGLTDGTDEAWGPAFKGQSYPQFNSPRTLNGQVIDFFGGDLNAPAGSVITPTLWVADKDNLKNFLNTGTALTNSVSFTGSNDKGDFRMGYTRLDEKGIVPNTDLKRNSLSLSGSYNLSDRLSAKAYVSYINSNSDNRPTISYGTESIMYLFNCWLPPSVKLSDMQRMWMKGLEGVRQYGFNYNYHDNPYFTLYKNTNGQVYDRMIGNASLKYDILDNLSLSVRAATDWSIERREYRRAFSTQRFPFGQYREVNLRNQETNIDFLFAYSKELNKDFSLTANFGGNNMQQESRFDENNAGQLNIPDIYNLSNSRIPLQVTQRSVGKRINSLYGSAGVSFRNKIFIDFTGRNDWSSALTLPEDLKAFGNEQNAYFYSSVALSAIVSDMIKLPAPFSYAKLRGSYAQVGNDTDPFTFTQSFNPSTAYGNFQIYGETDRLSNLSLKPEISNAIEVGTEMRFFGNRIGLDLTYYTSNTINQILNIPLSITSGYGSRSINAGKIRNWGYEAMLNIQGIRSRAFQWTTDINFSANRSKVIELRDGLTNLVMASRRVTVEARVGERMGDLYGIGFARVQNSDPNAPYYDASGKFVGQMVFDANNGRPVRTTNRIKLGNYNPDFMVGLNNSFTWKGVNLSFLFDIRSGGKLYSETQTVGREGGIIIESLEGRADGYDLTKDGNGVIGQGVVFVGGVPQVNTRKVAAREWHTAWTGGRGIAEGVMYDASFIKLRELQMGYTIPDKVWGKLPFRGVHVSMVGRNLLLWDRVPHVDPENMSYAGGTALPGIENMAIPSTRSYGINLRVKL